MKRRPRFVAHKGGILVFLLVLLFLSVLSACILRFTDRTDKQAVCRTDSLNTLAYKALYTVPDNALSYARRAYRRAQQYPDGQCEALNHQMCCYFLQMDYTKVYSLYEQVQQSTNNQIELLVSEVNMMMLCQQTSQNRSFYDYYNRAMQRMLRIEEEEKEYTGRYKERLFYAETEFHLVAATYYIYTMQEQQAARELSCIDEEGDIRKDKALQSRFYYLKGLSLLQSAEQSPENISKVFDNFLHAYSLAGRNSRMYALTAITAQSLALLLTDSYNRQTLEENRSNSLAFLRSSLQENDTDGTDDLPEDLRIPAALARNGLADAIRYDNLLLIANGYYTTGNILFAQKEYYRALAEYEKALSYINIHHRTFYPEDQNGLLSASRTDDTLFVDMLWAKDTEIQTVPAWLALIRERLSATYSALNNKSESDYHRNIYLDLLEFTRQDKSLESRIEQVEHDNRVLNGILIAVIVSTIALTVFILLYARMWNRRNKLRLSLLDEVYNRLKKSVSDKGNDNTDAVLNTYSWMRPENKLLQEVLQPYKDWTERNRTLADEMDEKRARLRMDLIKYERQIIENKRKNISKRAKVSLVYSITPFIDRILYTVRKNGQAGQINGESLKYIGELTEKINSCNEVLTDWIQLNRGQLDLAIESFPLQDLFGLLHKSDYSFRKKELTLTIHPTTAWVKADKALTFFMINTLADNARKFTPEGGHVTITAQELESAVEISVTDTSCGLSAEDVELIQSSKIYDADKIGGHDCAAHEAKGSGFGLLNCKGIIEKYKKTGALFNVCRFDIESTPGQGSRFSFRLPKGIVRLMCGVMAACTLLCAASQSASASSSAKSARATGQYLRTAVRYADSVYFANIDGKYEYTMQMADSALKYINLSYCPSLPAACAHEELTRTGGQAGEMEWWSAGAEADFRLIMALRNEIAVAALALHQWDVYEYNNTQYTNLYKLLSQDSSLEQFYGHRREVRMNLAMGITLLVVLAFTFVILIFVIHFRRRLLFRFNVIHVLEVHRSMLHIITRYDRSDNTDEMLRELLKVIFAELKELHETEGVKILLYNEVNGTKEQHAEGTILHPDLTDSRLESCHAQKEEVYDGFIHTQCYPLKVTADNDKEVCLGALAIHYGNYRMQKEDTVLERYVTGYLSILLYEAVICRSRDRENIELLENEKQKAMFEENRLRVQNQILDNCLSTIKHESMYYPSRIHHIVHSINLQDEQGNTDGTMRDLAELAGYYKELYTLLCAQADRQLAAEVFRCELVNVHDLAERWLARTRRICGKRQLHIVPELECQAENAGIHADKVLADYLLEVLTDEWMEQLSQNVSDTPLRLSVTEDGNFVRFALSTPAPVFGTEDTATLFYPDSARYPYLVCKEIVREHDKLNNFCGCRINAENGTDCGNRIWITLPKNQ